MVPVLGERDFEGLLIVEDGTSVPRPPIPPPVAPRSLRVAKSLVLADVKAALMPLPKLDTADFLWRAALEAACVGRTADAVVGARARIEGSGRVRRVVAWPGSVVMAPLSDAIVTTSGRIVRVDQST